MMTLETFHLFPALPSELRLKIWNLILTQPRIINLRGKKINIGKNWRFTLSVNSQPAALNVCRESRYEALNVYTPSLTARHVTTFTTTTEKPIPPPRTYINWEQDTIHCFDNVLQYISPESLLSIQKMELEVQDTAYFGHFYMEVIEGMKALKELWLFVKERGRNSWDNLERHLRLIQHDFTNIRLRDPGWACPRVTIMDVETGKIHSLTEGGAIVPGWKIGDEYPAELAEDSGSIWTVIADPAVV